MTLEYGKTITEPPKHLTVAFFEEVAENAAREAVVKLGKIHFEMGSSSGENYCSQIYRVKVEYQTASSGDEYKTVSLIIKSMLHSEAMDFLQDLQVFVKEKLTYNNVLPRLEVLLEPSQKFGARLYHSLREPINTLVFEDLGVYGYRMASREKGLDEAHCRLVMQRLAQFHGVSMMLHKRDPEIMKSYNTGMLGKAGIDRDSNMLVRYFIAIAKAVVETAAKWPGYEKIAKKLEKYVANVRENLVHAQAPVADELKVLNHGDLWVNNMLFKYSGQQQKPQDVIFVDFQISIWSSPGIDLNYFFYTSLQLPILQTKCDELLREYHTALCATLRQLNCDLVPSYQQILKEVQRRAAYGFFANYAIFPLVVMDKEASSDSSFDNYADEEFTRKKLLEMFRIKRLEDTLRYTLKHFDGLGIFD